MGTLPQATEELAVMNDFEKSSLRKELKRLQSEIKGFTFEALSKEVDMSRAVISQFANSRIDLHDNALRKIQEAIAVYTPAAETSDAVQSHPARFPLVVTNDFMCITAVAQTAYDRHTFNVVAGYAGLGKTTALRRFAESHEQVIFYTPDANITVKEFLIELGEELDVHLSRWDKITQMSRKIQAALIANPCLIIIDEFGRLIRNRNLRMIETLRDIHDQTDRSFGIVLSGHSEDLDFLMSGQTTQIYSRFGAVHVLTGLSQKEAEEMVSKLYMTPEAREEMIRLLCENTANGGIRSVCEELYIDAVEMAGSRPISLDDLQNAGKFTIYGYRAKRRKRRR